MKIRFGVMQSYAFETFIWQNILLSQLLNIEKFLIVNELWKKGSAPMCLI